MLPSDYRPNPCHSKKLVGYNINVKLL